MSWSLYKGWQLLSSVKCTSKISQLGILHLHHITTTAVSSMKQPESAVTDLEPSTENHQQSSTLDRGIGRLQGEQIHRLLLKPDQPPNAKLLKVAIIGLPNSGKSTLTNSLMGWRVSSVSKKVHTTRKNTVGIFTEGETQIVFLDTPGILSPIERKRYDLEKSLLIDPERSLSDADLVCVLVDASNRWTRNELAPLLLQVLHLHRDKSAVLVLNKVDLLKSKESLLQITRTLTCGIVNSEPINVHTKKMKKAVDYEELFDASDAQKSQLKRTLPEHHQDSPAITDSNPFAPPEHTSLSLSSSSSSALSTLSSSASPPSQSPEDKAWAAYFKKMRGVEKAVEGMKGWPYFKHVFFISALSGDGVLELKDYMLQTAKTGNWLYHSSLVTSQDPRDLVLMCVREKLMQHLKEEIPYNMHLDIVLWEVDEDGIFNIIINITPKTRRQITFLLGPKGQTIQKIASEAKQEMMNAFRCEMRLKLIAKTVIRKHK